jgi:hypothetical protein
MKRSIIGSMMALTLLLAACGGQVDEAASGTVVGRIEESALGPGATASATFNMAPGNYVLLCNVSGHYKEGMFAAFQVTAADGASGSTADVELGEWFVRPKVGSVASGPVTLEVTNKGGSGHNLVVIKTDLPPDGLVVK